MHRGQPRSSPVGSRQRKLRGEPSALSYEPASVHVTIVAVQVHVVCASELSVADTEQNTIQRNSRHKKG
jgi:hypothetical protein